MNSPISANFIPSTTIHMPLLNRYYNAFVITGRNTLLISILFYLTKSRDLELLCDCDCDEGVKKCLASQSSSKIFDA